MPRSRWRNSYGEGKTVVTLVPDTGRAYLSKFYDDNYMIDLGFLERKGQVPTVEEVLRFKKVGRGLPGIPDLITIESHQKVGEAIDLMQQYSISQLPVVRNAPTESLADVIGSLQERGLLDRVFRNPDALNEEVAAAMGPPLTAVDAAESIDRVFTDLSGGSAAVVVARAGRPAGMLTRADLLEYLAHHRGDGLRARRSRAYREPGDLRAMQRLAERTWRIDPATAAGDRRRPRLDDASACRPRERVDAAGVARGRGGGERLGLDQAAPVRVSYWGVDPRRSELLDEVFGWFEATAEERPRWWRCGRRTGPPSRRSRRAASSTIPRFPGSG